MKKIIMMSLLVAANVASAQAVPGAIEKHDLQCVSVKHRVGIDVSLECFTQALAPQNSLRGCNLLFTVVAPGAKPRVETLKIVAQDANDAKLTGATSTVVELNKRNMTADIYNNTSLEYTCR